ncbi:hypothetical protein LguiB_005863 [Lonicera macranthoides]
MTIVYISGGQNQMSSVVGFGYFDTMSTFSKLLLLFSLLFFALILTADSVDIVSDSSLNIELDQLKSKISILESSIAERTQELKRKDENIKQLEGIIQEKLDSVALLRSEMQLLQLKLLGEMVPNMVSEEKGSLGAKEPVGKAGELKKQVDNLQKEIEVQKKKEDALRARANVAEEKIQELNLKLENLQSIRDEQKIRISKIERALQLAEEEMMKAKFEAIHISNELKEVREAWLPSWLVGYLGHCQSFIVTHWNEHGKRALDMTIQKALEKKAQLAKWVEPHIIKTKKGGHEAPSALSTSAGPRRTGLVHKQAAWSSYKGNGQPIGANLKKVEPFWTVKGWGRAFKTMLKGIPVMKEYWGAFVSNIEPTVQSLTANTVYVYHSSKSIMGPYFIRIQKIVDPYFQEAKKVTKPYINQVSTVTKPYIVKTRTFLKPYTKKVHRGYKKFIRTTTGYHRQVRATIHETLKEHELTKPLATNELVWYLATSLMALPVILLFQTASSMFREKPKKRVRSSHTGHHTRRRPKRMHPDKRTADAF